MSYRILCFGDSNTWGHIPGTDSHRYPFSERYPGVLEAELGGEFRVIEEALNGRTTMYPDPSYSEVADLSKSGLRQLPFILKCQKPIDLIILMLGTNDMKNYLNLTAKQSGFGIRKLVQLIRNTDYGGGMQVPKIMLISPPLIHEVSLKHFPEMEEAPQKSLEFSKEYQKVSLEYNLTFLDAAARVNTTEGDGVHIDAEGHQILGKAVAKTIIDSKLFTPN